MSSTRACWAVPPVLAAVPHLSSLCSITPPTDVDSPLHPPNNNPHASAQPYDPPAQQLLDVTQSLAISCPHPACPHPLPCPPSTHIAPTPPTPTPTPAPRSHPAPG